MVYVFLAKGFEETEALVPVDILRRADINVCTVGIGSEWVEGSHGIAVKADIKESSVKLNNDVEAIVLPGGMPGTKNLEKNKTVNEAIDYAASNGKIIAAICAAPSILGNKGMLNNSTATCYPGFEKTFGTGTYSKEKVCVDISNYTLLTSQGPGTAADFAFELLTLLTGDKQKTENLAKEMRFFDAR